MAYNNGFPIGYQTPYQQSYYPMQNYQTQQTQPQQTGIIWVQGEAAAKSYPIAPNTSVALWDSEANVIYIKSADGSGMPSMKIVDYTMRETGPRKAEISAQSDYVTKDDLLPIRKEIDALKAKIEGDRDAE